MLLFISFFEEHDDDINLSHHLSEMESQKHEELHSFYFFSFSGRFFPFLSVLVHVGDDAVRHSLTILIPILSILPFALVIITINALDEENHHEDDVEVGENVAGTLEGEGE